MINQHVVRTMIFLGAVSVHQHLMAKMGLLWQDLLHRHLMGQHSMRNHLAAEIHLLGQNLPSQHLVALLQQDLIVAACLVRHSAVNSVYSMCYDLIDAPGLMCCVMRLMCHGTCWINPMGLAHFFYASKNPVARIALNWLLNLFKRNKNNFLD